MATEKPTTEITTTGKVGEIGTEKAKVSETLISLLGMYRLNFNLTRDISDQRILKILSSGYYFIKNFEENGYGCIFRKEPDMGTGYSLVTEQYFEKRGSIQGIYLYKQSHRVGTTSYQTENGGIIYTNIYLVGSIPSSGKPLSGGLHDEDIGKAYRQLIGE